MKNSYPWLALGLGLVLSLVLYRYGTTASGKGMPLLTALLMSEFGFLVTAIAAGMGLRDLGKQGIQAATLLPLVGNALLAANFLRLGLAFWLQTAG